MSLLKEVANEQARAKVGIFGSQGSGKTTTAALLALGVSKTFHNGAPVAFMDTENGSDYLKPLFDAEGVKLLVHKSGAFSDMAKVLKEAETSDCCAFIMDSVTHTWRELREAYCARKAAAYKRATYSMQFQDWKEVKEQWAQWTRVFLNSPVHCFIAGRAGYEYEYQENEDTHKKELVKGDTKMKAEGEFGYEPSLLIEMEAVRRDTNEAHRGGSFLHVAYILKDRARFLNGKHFEFPDLNQYKAGGWKPVFKAFEPHFSFLNISATQHAIDSNTSQELFDGNGDGESFRRNKQKQIALEEITAIMQLQWPGQDAKSKSLRLNIMQTIWGTRAWSAIEGMFLEKVEAGLDVLRTYEEKVKTAEGVDTEEGILTLISLAKTISEVKGSSPRPAEVTKAIIPDLPKSNIVYPDPPKAMKSDADEDDEELREIECVRMNGSLLLSGSGTFHMKDDIKKIGGRWNKDRKSWEVPAGKHSELLTACQAHQIPLVDVA